MGSRISCLLLLLLFLLLLGGERARKGLPSSLYNGKREGEKRRLPLPRTDCENDSSVVMERERGEGEGEGEEKKISYGCLVFCVVVGDTLRQCCVCLVCAACAQSTACPRKKHVFGVYGISSDEL